jgi:hypothetical protein
MKLPSPELLRLTRNLEKAPLTDVLGAAAISMEAVRELLVDLFRACGGSELDRELFDASLKPLIRELITRRLELEAHPPHAARGNA